MHCRVEPDVRDGLKVISEIPDIDVCMIEGRNGIGKTVLFQLLELISGSIPEDFIRRPALWLSLRERLGRTHIELDQLHDGRRLAFTFTPDRWIEGKLPTQTGEWLGEATVDGTATDVAAVASMLSVTRISGDEDLEVTLRRRVETLKGYLTFAAARARERGHQVDKRLAEILSDIRRADPADLERDSQALAITEAQLEEAKKASSLADDRLRHLLRALDTRLQLEAASQATEDLLAKRDQLVARVTEANEGLERAEAEAEAADAAYAAEGDAQRALTDAERLLRNRTTRLANIQRRTREIEVQLSYDFDMPAAGPSAALRACDSELDRLTAEYRSLDSTSLVRDVIAEVTLPLQTAQNEVGDQLLVRLPDGGLTVAETLAGVTARGAELADQPEPEQLRQLASRIDAARSRRELLLFLLQNLEQEQQLQDRVSLAKEEASTAAEQVQQASEAAERSRLANQAVGAAQETQSKAYAELASIQQQIGSAGATSREDAEADLAAALEQLGLNETQLDEAEPAARAALHEADRALAELEASASTIRRRLTVRQTEIDLMIDHIQGNPQYRWLLEASPDLRGQLQAPETRYVAFGKLRSGLIESSESSLKAANLLSSLVGIAGSFFETAPATTDETPSDLTQQLRPGFEAVLGQRLKDALNSPSIRKDVFDDAEVKYVQPASAMLTLKDKEGNITNRSMDAFSSGERAFAFTQARIADLDQPQKPNRLLVLDEFGAYVAADRLPDLATFLESQTKHIADQVIVILPLHVDYAREIDDTRGALRERYEERLAQVDARGYCAVRLL
jgi:hypothetical protein